jgi:hypothetical protein
VNDSQQAVGNQIAEATERIMDILAASAVMEFSVGSAAKRDGWIEATPEQVWCSDRGSLAP